MAWDGDAYFDHQLETRSPGERCDDTGERRQAARRHFLDAPPYRIDFETDGTVSLCVKRYEWRDDMQPEDATSWVPVSRHPTLDEAERRLRHICSGPHFYDAEGRLVRAPRGLRPLWESPPDEG